MYQTRAQYILIIAPDRLPRELLEGCEREMVLDDDDGDVVITWDDSGGGAWSAKGVSGPLEGRVMRCDLESFSVPKWDNCGRDP